jgi:hypothetical protein
MIITVPIESATPLIIDQASISSELFPNKAPTVTATSRIAVVLIPPTTRTNKSSFISCLSVERILFWCVFSCRSTRSSHRTAVSGENISEESDFNKPLVLSDFTCLLMHHTAVKLFLTGVTIVACRYPSLKRPYHSLAENDHNKRSALILPILPFDARYHQHQISCMQQAISQMHSHQVAHNHALASSTQQQIVPISGQPTQSQTFANTPKTSLIGSSCMQQADIRLAFHPSCTQR